MLELFEQPADHQPKVFFETRANITFKVVDDELGIKKAVWYLIPKDEMRPSLQLERGQTLMAILFQQSGRYQIAVNLDAWSYFDGIRWTQIESETTISM